MDTKSDDRSEFGNLLLQKRGLSTVTLVLVLAALVLSLIAGISFFISMNASYTDTILMVSFLLIVFLIPLAIKYRRTISIYDRGVVLTTLLKNHSILYKDLSSIRFLIKRTNFGANYLIFAFLPRVDDEVKFLIGGSFHSIMETAQIMEAVIHPYPDIQMYGDMVTLKSYGTKVKITENKGIVNKKIEL